MCDSFTAQYFQQGQKQNLHVKHQGAMLQVMDIELDLDWNRNIVPVINLRSSRKFYTSALKGHEVWTVLTVYHNTGHRPNHRIVFIRVHQIYICLSREMLLSSHFTGVVKKYLLSLATDKCG